MYANIEWRVGTEVPSRVFRTVLQDFKKSIGIFLLFQGLIALRFLNEIFSQGGIPTVSFFGSRFPKCLKF